MRDRQPPLLHRRRRQGREADHVPRRVDVRHRRLEVLVHRDLAAFVRSDPRRVEAEEVAVRLPTHRVQQRVTLHRFAALELRDHAITVPRHRQHLLAEAERHAILAQVMTQRLDHLVVRELEQGRSLVDQRHARVERRHHRRVLEADHAAADHDQLARNEREVQQLIRVEHPLPVRHDQRVLRRSRPAGDEDRVRRDLRDRTVRVLDLDRVRIGEARHPVDGRNPIALELGLHHVDLALEHDVHAL
jgi:hypothetical protein